MTRDEKFSEFQRAIGCLSLELPRAVYRDFCAVADEFFAALRAPAVTGEAAQHADTLCELAHDGCGAGEEGMLTVEQVDACRAGAEALAAPPAAGAPPALVALVEKLRVTSGDDVTRYRAGWNDALAAVLGLPAPAPDTAPQMLNEDPVIAAKTRTVMQQIALNNMTTVEQCPGLLAFGPIYRALAASAPVAPPADYESQKLRALVLGSPAPPADVSGSAGIDWQAERDRCAFPSPPALSVEDAHAAKSITPALPAVAGGDAPEPVKCLDWSCMFPGGRCERICYWRRQEGQ